MNKPKITKIDKAILRYLNCKIEEYPNRRYKYIARNNSGQLYLYANKPFRHSIFTDWSVMKGYYALIPLKKEFLKFIKWDDEKPWKISDLLKLGVENDN